MINMNKLKFINIPVKLLNLHRLININDSKIVELIEKIIQKIKFSTTKSAKKKWKSFYSQRPAIVYKNIYYPDFLIRNNSFLRINDKYYFAQDHYANINILNWIMIDFFKKNNIHKIKSCSILELGSGYGYNLINITKKFTNIKKIIASDYSFSSLKIAKNNLKKNKITNFDIKKINYKDIKDFRFKKKIDVVFTRHALEQNKNCSEVISNILSLSPKIVIHIEPILDFYNNKKKFDKIAYNYHKKRGYLNSFLNHLTNKKIKILNLSKYKFGNMFNDSCGAIAWKIL